MGWKVAVEPWLRPLFHLYSRLSRGVSLEALGIVLNADGQVLLVRCDNEAPWTLPISLVAHDRGPEAGLAETVKRESGRELYARPSLLGIVRSSGSNRRHRLLYRAVAGEPIVGDQAAPRGNSCWAVRGALPTTLSSEARALIEDALSGSIERA